MRHSYGIVTTQIVPACIGLLGLWCSIVIADDNAQDGRSGAASVTAVFANFEKTWNNEAWGPSRGQIGKYMRPTDDVGWKVRMTAFQQLVRSGTQGAPEMVKALSSESTPVRALAAQALGYCGKADAKSALAHVVEHDADAMVRLYAADSLGMLGGRNHDELLRRIEASEKNRDTKRHIGYALDRKGQGIDAGVARRIQHWNIEDLESASLNRLAPDFELASLDGQRVRLSHFRGKKSVVLVFVYGDT